MAFVVPPPSQEKQYLRHRFRGTGLGVPFSTGDLRANVLNSQQEAYKYSIINYFLTEPGERVEAPTFGGGLRKFVFRQISTDGSLVTTKNTGLNPSQLLYGVDQTLLTLVNDDISQFIRARMQVNFPKAEVQEILIGTDPDSNQIVIQITYAYQFAPGAGGTNPNYNMVRNNTDQITFFF